MIVLDVEEQPVALLVDKVQNLIEVDSDDFLDLPGWLHRCCESPVVGAVEGEDGELILVLATDLFDREEIEILKEYG